MNSIQVAILAGMTAISSTSLLRFQFRKLRASRFRGLELKPNCLLTRYPIVFLSKQKSLFRIFDDWSDVPKYLREHGYEVLILTPLTGYELPSVLKALDDMPAKCHLFAGTFYERLIEDVARVKHPQVSSLTFVEEKPKSRRADSAAKPSVDDLKPLNSAVEVFTVNDSLSSLKTLRDRTWTLESKFLDHAISLAERDAEWCD